MKNALIVPCFNHGDGIRETFERIKAWQQTQTVISRVYFVDDGSQDETGDQLVRLGQGEKSWCEIIRHPTNRGKGAAIRTGFNAARSWAEAVAFTDCDLHYGLDILTDRLFPELETHDVVMADRSWNVAGHGHSLLRRLSSAIFNRAMAILTGVIFRDTQAGLKGFRVDTCGPVFDLLRLTHFAFDVEILSLALYYRLRIKRIPIRIDVPDNAPSHSIMFWLQEPLQMVFDLIRINWNWKRGRYHSDVLKKAVESEIYKIQRPAQRGIDDVQ